MRNLTWLSMVGMSLVIGCGPGGRPDGSGDKPDGGTEPDADNTNGNGNTDGCSDEAKLVFVVDGSNQLSTFEPSTKSFTPLGTLDCPAELGAVPFSMGIDRTPTAWVLYDSGELFKVDTKTLECTATNWNHALGLSHFGMGFSTDAAAGTTDSLFVAGGGLIPGPTVTMAKLDTQTMSATSIGMVTGNPELTGTGNAELWGWFPDATAPKIMQLDKATGAGIKTFQLPTLAGQPGAWAFAFWGGDFWIFLMKGFETSTTVYQVDGTTGMVKGQSTAGGRVIVGAGVSTCAPVVIF
ncbi:MAG: hypothetical protein AB7O24_28265 [Kofleriaceae bacterium]